MDDISINEGLSKTLNDENEREREREKGWKKEKNVEKRAPCHLM